jgi:hypothetical protein
MLSNSMRATRKGAQKPDLGHIQYDDDGCEQLKSSCGKATMQCEMGLELAAAPDAKLYNVYTNLYNELSSHM